MARFTGLDEWSELEDFLFGVDRVSLDPIRPDLRELQHGRCFYCERPIAAAADVDHFIPRARYVNDAIDNLVLAHRGCNTAKLDHLAAVDHLERWVERGRTQAADLDKIARSRTWASRPHRTEAVARSIYLRLPEDVRLWRLGKEFVPVDRERLLSVFNR